MQKSFPSPYQIKIPFLLKLKKSVTYNQTLSLSRLTKNNTTERAVVISTKTQKKIWFKPFSIYIGLTFPLRKIHK